MTGSDDDRDRERRRREGTTFDAGLHDMGGDIGPASTRGSNAHPGGDPRDDAAPKGGWSSEMGYVTGRDDEWPESAGSDEKAVGARTDEIEGHVETAGPSPRPVPDEVAGPRDNPDAGRRARGPVQGGVPEDDGPLPERAPPPSAGHVGAGVEWVPSDEDDPDGGSGRTDQGDGGYLPGEATGRAIP
ncbi:hypothetical protein Sru01_58630 [Sphaerisporangium rufum]|uniref:DUF5709 domain-containing protein n=1 Tax=Sphaerisporangium rufum TaxID=1381558 RepID=A0A919R9G1_9ACTN|nr:hypothetical protein [Sphaerisporangium rufum]GII80881.1 hypothetical protein Sru01_58630 [Sphaerisporangium rufum]